MAEYLLLLAKIIGIALVVVPIILAAITVEIDYYFKSKAEAHEKTVKFDANVLGEFGKLLTKLAEEKKNEISK